LESVPVSMMVPGLKTKFTARQFPLRSAEKPQHVNHSITLEMASIFWQIADPGPVGRMIRAPCNMHDPFARFDQPSKHLIRVVLPDPLGPTTAIDSPALRLN
jgi:hypothetical protein